MRKSFTRLIITVLFLLALCIPAISAGAQDSTATPSPSNTPAPQNIQPVQDAPTDRPLVVIESYYLDKDTIRPGDSFNLYLSIKNIGSQDAHNLIFTFSGTDFLPQETGGVIAIGTLGAGQSRDLSQRLVASTSLWGYPRGTVGSALSYESPAGTAYSASFTITLDILGWSGVSSTTTPTPTATTFPRPQLVVNSYSVDVDPLQPGSIFTLEMNIRNLGNSDARSVTLVLGGGGSNLDTSGTPQPGGVSGSSGDTSTFAPIGSSNLVFLGDVPSGTEAKSSQKVIVNTSANPGAYTLKISLVYNDIRGTRLVDDQVITLLVYRLPQVEVNFYRDPGMIMAMQPNQLPIQVVNLGRTGFVFGNMTVTGENVDLTNNTMLVGALDAGGYFPLDVMAIPNQAGPLELKVTLNYTDDFNQSRTIIQALSLDVLEAAPVDPGLVPGDPNAVPGSEQPVDVPVVEESLWDKVVRFFRGLFGLDSGVPQQTPVDPGVPVEPGKPLPGGGGGGGGGKG
jgi:hypothetical protein